MIINFAVENQYDVCDLDFSPITGGHGNIEFLIHLRAVDREGQIAPEIDPHRVVQQAHATLIHLRAVDREGQIAPEIDPHRVVQQAHATLQNQ